MIEQEKFSTELLFSTAIHQDMQMISTFLSYLKMKHKKRGEQMQLVQVQRAKLTQTMTLVRLCPCNRALRIKVGETCCKTQDSEGIFTAAQFYGGVVPSTFTYSLSS